MTGIAMIATSIRDRECQALWNEYDHLICSAVSIPLPMLAEGNANMDCARKIGDLFCRRGAPRTHASVRWPSKEH